MYKNILFISTDKHLGEVIRRVLIRKSMDVVLASTLEEVKRFVDRDYDIILFETLFGENDIFCVLFSFKKC
jgi:DNA-binding response OmpR family regulator